ncbi:unnamed protein product [Durusdinium trenchii]|uniref:C3H1-type domain-containing protein n=1 Tax=Durusdinium trenchii TaxID=1381693 RepID=A0ABP0HUT3_9DINO
MLWPLLEDGWDCTDLKTMDSLLSRGVLRVSGGLATMHNGRSFGHGFGVRQVPPPAISSLDRDRAGEPQSRVAIGMNSMKLTYRNGFIDVDEGASFAHWKRSQSFPLPANEPEEELQMYVGSLVERMNEVEATECGATSAPSDAPAEWLTPNEPRKLAPERPEDMSSAVWSLGSMGHPELCSRPCIHFMARNCEKGESCNFCHIQHPEKPVKLDKKQRTVIRALSARQLAGIILPSCRARLEATGIATGEEILSILEKLVQNRNDAEEDAAINEHDLRHVRRTLQRMSVSSLLSVFTHQQWLHSARLIEAFEELRERTPVVRTGPVSDRP